MGRNIAHVLAEHTYDNEPACSNAIYPMVPQRDAVKGIQDARQEDIEKMQLDQKKKMQKGLRRAKDAMMADYSESEEDQKRQEEINGLVKYLRTKLTPEDRKKFDTLVELQDREVVAFSDAAFQNGAVFGAHTVSGVLCKDGKLCPKCTNEGKSA